MVKLEVNSNRLVSGKCISIPRKTMFFRMACARRLPAKAADRGAGLAGGNSESAQRNPAADI